MSGSAEKLRAYRGPALLSFGFRPLFLGASIWAAAAMALWLAMLSGAVAAPGAFDPVSWHVHEMLFGYAPAVVAGFLLTAVPNWTGRLPITGAPLAALALTWAAGRAAMLAPSAPVAMAAAVDLAFLAALVAVIGREIAAGRNWRNLPVLALAAALFAGNLIFHIEGGAGGHGARIGIAAVVFLILLIGGRVTPSFTRNWLARRTPGPLPAPPMGRFDLVALAGAAAALVAWIVRPEGAAAGWLCLLAGGLHAARLARWAGWRCGAEPLVWVLHVGYGFAALGFLLVAGATLAPEAFPRIGALHAWMAGAVGVTPLAMMTRASLGHGGRPLTATPAIAALYAAAIMAALARIAAGWMTSQTWLLHLSAAAWIAAFAGFTVVFWPILTRPRA